METIDFKVENDNDLVTFKKQVMHMTVFDETLIDALLPISSPEEELK